MGKFIQINDVHLSDRPPRFRKDTYKDDVLGKIADSLYIGLSTSVDFVLFTGDVFHHPQASKVSHELVNDLMHLFNGYSMLPIYIVPGNHDIAAGRLESLPKQPLGTLGLLPNVTVMEDGEMYAVGGLTLACVGWNYRIDAGYIQGQVSKTGQTNVLALHAPIAPKSNPFFKTIQPEEIADLADVVCYGHIHTPHPARKVGGSWFSNPGSLARRVLGGNTDDEAERHPQIACIEFDPGRYGPVVEYVDVPHKPMEEVYRLDLHEVAISDDEALTAFVQSLGEAELSSVTAENLIQEAQAMTDDVRVKEMLETILMQVA